MTSTSTRATRLNRARLAGAATLSVASLLALGAGPASAARLPDVTVKVLDRTLHVDGSAGRDDIVLRIRPNESTILQVLASGRQVGNIDRSRFSRIDVRGNSGDDTIRVDESFGTFAAANPTTLDGGAGDDTLIGGVGPVRQLGGAGNDLLLGGDAIDTQLGGDGNDTIDGNKANDVAFGGAGNDTFIWDPGDASDAFDGEGGFDTLVFNGSAGNEKFELSNNHGRFLFTRDLGGIRMDIGTTESVVANALGGADQVTVDDLTGTDVVAVRVDLLAPAGSGTGDGAADQVIVRGTDGNDALDLDANASSATVSGLHARVTVGGAEAARDRLDIETGSGFDLVDTSGVAAGAFPIFFDGQAI
jgi:hypothetical protein